MYKNRRKKLELIACWIYLIERLQKINHELFDHTEYYEHKYEDEFEEELFRFFAGKITIFQKWLNEIQGKTNIETLRKNEKIVKPLLSEDDLKELRHITLTRYI